MLVTQADIEARLGRVLTAEEATRITSLLSDITNYITSYTGKSFAVETFSKILREHYGSIDIPDRPVISVSSIKPINDDGSPGSALPFYSFDGLYTISFVNSDYVVNAPEWWGERCTHTYQVNYTAGYSTVPADIADVAGRAVVAALQGGTLGAPSGVSALTVGDVAYRFANASMGQVADSITDIDRDILNKYRGKNRLSTISLRR